MEVDYIFLIVVVFIFVSLTIYSIILTAKLIKLKKDRDALFGGSLYINDDDEIYSEFGVSIEELKKRKFLLFKVNYVKSKKERK